MRLLFALLLVFAGAVPSLAMAVEMSPEREKMQKGPQFVSGSMRISMLHKAIRDGNVEQVRRALHLGIDPNQRGRDGETAIELAIERAGSGGHGVEMLEYLVQGGADINGRGSAGLPPLIQALKSNHMEAARLLVRKGADLTAIDQDGNTPLHLAITKNNQEAFDFLVSRKAGIDVPNKRGETPLHWALRNNRPAMALELVTAGSDLTARDKEGETALDIAAQKGYFDVVAVLFLKGASLSERGGKSQNTPLHYAAGVADLDSVQFLIDSGARINAVNANGDTPLIYAAGNPQARPELIEYFAQNGAELDQANHEGTTALHEAARVGNAAAIEMLFKHGARSDVVDREHRTPLYFAALNGHLEAVRVLVKHNAYLNTKPSPLQAAIDNQHQDVVHFLIQSGAKL